MGRSGLLTCLLSVCFVGTLRAGDTRSATLGVPTSLTPYAPASAYLPPGAFDPAFKQAGATGPVGPAAAQQVAPASAAPNYPPAGAACDPIERLRCTACGPDERGWVTADYLLWAVRGSGTPPLVARDLPGTARPGVGVPSTPGQQILFGGQGGLNGDLRSGFRIGGGY